MEMFFFINTNNTVKVSMTKLIHMSIYQLVKLNFQTLVQP